MREEDRPAGCNLSVSYASAKWLHIPLSTNNQPPRGVLTIITFYNYMKTATHLVSHTGDETLHVEGGQGADDGADDELVTRARVLTRQVKAEPLW